MSYSLRLHELQHARLPCPRVCSNSCPLRRGYYLIVSSVTPFSSCSPSFPASGSFPMSRLCASGGQSTGASALASVLLVNIQGRFSLGLGLPWGSKVKASACKGTDWFDLAVQGTPWTLLQHYKLCMYPWCQSRGASSRLKKTMLTMLWSKVNECIRTTYFLPNVSDSENSFHFFT